MGWYLKDRLRMGYYADGCASEGYEGDRMKPLQTPRVLPPLLLTLRRARGADKTFAPPQLPATWRAGEAAWAALMDLSRERPAGRRGCNIDQATVAHARSTPQGPLA